MSKLQTQAPFDFVWFGWGVWSQITQTEELETLLKSLKCHSPSAVILSSYILEAKNYSAGIHYFPHAGFLRVYSESHIDHVLKKHGYSTIFKASHPYPHILFQNT